jgi:hypothetical protein
MKRLVLVSFLLALGGCTHWAKPGGTPEALSADQSACTKAADEDFPTELAPAVDPGVGSVQPGYACLPGRGCVPTGSSFMPSGASVLDKNAAPRAAAVDHCMTQRGWTR